MPPEIALKFVGFSIMLVLVVLMLGLMLLSQHKNFSEELQHLRFVCIPVNGRYCWYKKPNRDWTAFEDAWHLLDCSPKA